MKILLLNCVLITSAFLLLACGDRPPSETSTRRPEPQEAIDIAKILSEKNMPEKKMAEKLVAEGEKLFSVIGFMFAHEIFQKALKVDPTNKKALFYYNITRPLMGFRGILRRIEPLVSNGSSQWKKYHKQGVAKLMSGGLRDFLLDGQSDFTSERDFQKFLADQLESINSTRLWIKKNKDMVLEIRANISTQDVARYCSVKKIKEDVYERSQCDEIEVRNLKLSRPDLEVLQHIFAGIQTSFTLFTSYDGTGLAKIERLADSTLTPTEEQIVTILNDTNNFGRLLDGNSMKIVPELGADIYQGAKWAHKFQEKLCPPVAQGKRVRRPGMLVEGGLCIPDVMSDGRPIDRVFGMLDIALQGLPQNYDFVKEPEAESLVVTSARINPLAWFFEPPEDLKPMFPTKFDSCGNGVNFGDPHLGGIFPDGDANRVKSELLQFEQNIARTLSKEIKCKVEDL